MKVNPFKFGGEVSGTDFCDREEEITELSQDIRNGANVLLYSPRRLGKTSLVKRVLDLMEREGFITVYVDLYPAITKEKFIEIYAGAISKSIHGSMEKTLAWIKRTVPKLVPKVAMRTEGTDIEFEFDRTQPYRPIFSDLFGAVNQQAKTRGKSAVVVFDEFQEITNYPDDEVEREMRSVFQTHSNVSYLFLGSKRRILYDMFENPNRPFYRSAKHVPLGKIPEGAFQSFISAKFRKGGYMISDESVSKILKLCEGHPHHTQQLCYFVWERSAETEAVTDDSLQSALRRLLDTESQGYGNLWDSFTQKQRQLLAAIAEDEPSSVFSKDFLQKHLLGSSSGIQKALKVLMQREVLLKENGRYLFEDVFFKRWVLDTFV